MGQPATYDEDILLWSEQQADVIRRLGRTRSDLPNELDIENVAEEIESVGRSELAAVESYIELILVHLVKLALEPEAEASRHWRAEVVSFHGNMKRRYAESMRQRIGLAGIWRQVREQAIVASPEPAGVAVQLPEACPFVVDDFLEDRINTSLLADRLVASKT